LALGSLVVLSSFWFGEGSFIFLPGSPLDFGSMAFSLFTDVSLVM
jgi:hypothetical protein